jgi:hypothetical protein
VEAGCWVVIVELPKVVIITLNAFALFIYLASSGSSRNGGVKFCLVNCGKNFLVFELMAIG